MTTALSEFADVAEKIFVVDPTNQRVGISGPLIYERGTRSLAASLFKAGFRCLGDLNQKNVLEVIRDHGNKKFTANDAPEL